MQETIKPSYVVILDHNPHTVTFIVPIGSTKKWWQFWKSNKKRDADAKAALQMLLDEYKKDVNFDNN